MSRTQAKVFPIGNTSFEVSADWYSCGDSWNFSCIINETNNHLCSYDDIKHTQVTAHDIEFVVYYLNDNGSCIENATYQQLVSIAQWISQAAKETYPEGITASEGYYGV